MKTYFLCLAIFLLWNGRNPVLADSDGVATLTLTGASVPFYPPLARDARVQGTVIVDATTAGEAFGGIKVVSGHPLLSPAVIANLRTWTLVNAPVAHFRITYHYKIGNACKGRPTVILNLPATVSVCSPPSPPMYSAP
jgi:hypothetical protein